MAHLPLSRDPSLARDKSEHKCNVTFCQKKKKEREEEEEKEKRERERGAFGMGSRLIGILVRAYNFCQLCSVRSSALRYSASATHRSVHERDLLLGALERNQLE
jgi:hypothetical protein